VVNTSIYVDLERVQEIFWGGQQIDVNEKPLVQLKETIDHFPLHMTVKKPQGWRYSDLHSELFVKIAGKVYVDTRKISGIIEAA